MALFQPTNIIPASLIGQGTVDVENNMEISWQVNGNSAMTAFQIDFYMNDTASTYVTSTNKITTGIPTGGFYGTDRFGNPQFFSYNANEPWNVYDGKFSNGNEYKFKITQFWNTNDEIYSVTPSISLTGSMYMILPTGITPRYVIFNFGGSTYSSSTVFFNRTQQKGWIVNANQAIIPIATQTAQYSDISGLTGFGNGTAVASADKYDFVTQNSASIFVTRATPTLTIYQTNENYLNPVSLPSTIATSIGYFQADYAQDQNDAIRWIRWQVAQANNGVVVQILADTGDIYTPTLDYEFNGFFNGQQYAIRCFGESESGQDCDTGWLYFTINIENQSEYTGEFTAQCLNKENAVLLEWEGVEVIPPTVSPDGYSPPTTNGSVTLNTNSSITWNKQGANPMNFLAPWTAVWKGQISRSSDNYVSKANVNTLFLTLTKGNPLGFAFSADGSLCVYSTDTNVYLYSVSGSSFAFLSEIQYNNAPITSAKAIAFGKNYLVVGKYLFRVSGQSVTNGQEISVESNSSGRSAKFVEFKPNSDVFVYGIGDTLGGNSSNRTYECSINTNTNAITVLADLGESDFAHFSSNGTKLALSTGIYTVRGTSITQLISQDFTGEAFLNTTGDKVLSRNDRNLAIYSVVGQTLVLQSDLGIFAPTSDYVISPDFKMVAAYRSINITSTTFTFYSIDEGVAAQIYTRTYSTTSGYVYQACAFKSDSSIFVLACNVGNNIMIVPTYSYHYYQQGKLFELQGNNISLSRHDSPLIVSSSNTQLASISVPDNTTSAAVIFTPTTVNAFFYDDNGLISQSSTPITYTQQAISSVAIYGGTTGATIDGVSVYQGDGSNILSLYQNLNFEPMWNDENYSLYMSANFNGNLEGGTGTSSGDGFRVYRQEVGTTILTPIATVPSTVTSLKDYGIVSRKAYQYSLYAYDNNDTFMSAVEAENTIATNFKNYSLLVCDYDQTNDEYHVRKQYLFALNLTDGSVGNNNSPTLNANFTQYPTRMPSTQNYASGTLSGLIGAIYTVPALIEQIGQYKYTAKPSTIDYFDSVDLEKELYSLSVAPYQLFLRDMKGRLRMIATSSPITMTTNIKQKQQSISISLPWVEVGDASDVTIIQTPDDYGWDNDNQVLDVQLDVDVATGELSAQYPFPYNGTKFYLTGANKETLTAKTPLGVTPAQFELSKTAEQPDDGELTATVNVNTETNSNNN